MIIAAEPQTDGTVRVGVCPITHSPIDAPEHGVELPPATKRRLGLDEDRSWVVATELNRFVWPGFDLRRTPDGREAWGVLSGVLLRAVIERLVEQARDGQLSRVDRES